MSGTSLDGVDAALVEFDDEPATQPSAKTQNTKCRLVQTHSLPYSAELRANLLALQTPSENELEQAALLGNALATLYAEVVNQLLEITGLNPVSISAIGSHGQTIRHRPELGFTLQIGNAALLAELTQIDVVADFRSRDVAAGGQGAPLVPAFHQAVFAHPTLNRVIINIGGIANLTYLSSHGAIYGFDSGPGNMLMDAWVEQHLGQRYDASGQWAMTGIVDQNLLDSLLSDPYFALPPPKSTGRDLFNLSWLEQHLTLQAPQDIQRTLLALTAVTIANAVDQTCEKVDEIYLCGGGAHNTALIQCLRELLNPVKIKLTNDLSIDVNWVEATAFAWLAKQAMQKSSGNLPAVTGAIGARILGAIYAR